jgi:hypothetical protein
MLWTVKPEAYLPSVKWLSVVSTLVGAEMFLAFDKKNHYFFTEQAGCGAQDATDQHQKLAAQHWCWTTVV